MTAREIALSAATLLQADDMEESIAAAEKDSAVAALDADVRTLFKCIELAAGEMIGDGFPVLFKVTATAVGGHITIDDPSAASVVRVEKDGTPVHFTVDGGGVNVRDGGEYTVTYSRMRGDVATVDAEIKLGAGADADMMTYLSTRNYCLVTGRTDEASVWDQRYVAESEKRRIKRRARLPRRPWR